MQKPLNQNAKVVPFVQTVFRPLLLYHLRSEYSPERNNTRMKKNQFTDEEIVAIMQQAEKGEKPFVCELANQPKHSLCRWYINEGHLTS
jgi:hypothetical protein